MAVQTVSSKSFIPLFSLDWLAVTIKDFQSFDDVFRELSRFLGEKIFSRGRGARGYSDSADILDGGFVAWSSDKPQNGIHVVLNARSLALLSGYSALELLQFFYSLGGVATRIDFAFDDMSGLLDLDVIASYLRAGQVSTRWKMFQVVRGRSDVGKSDFQGYTIYVGSRKSESFLRFYDKKAERENKGFEVEHEKWVRVELELKDKKAAKVFEICAGLVDDVEISEYVSGLLYGLIDFKAWSDTDVLISRVPTARFWKVFLRGVSKVNLSLPKKERSIDALRGWIADTVAPSLAVVADLPRGDDWLKNVLRDGRARWKKKHRVLYFSQLDEDIDLLQKQVTLEDLRMAARL